VGATSSLKGYYDYRYNVSPHHRNDYNHVVVKVVSELKKPVKAGLVRHVL